MRGMVPGLPSSSPMLLQLPGVYQEGDFTARFVAAFDDALAPIMSTLDNLPAYVDPGTAPTDLLSFLAYWVGLGVDGFDEQAVPIRRASVAAAVSVHRLRGTAAGVCAAVRSITGGEVDVIESGATTFSTVSGAGMTGTTPPQVKVVVTVEDPTAVDLAEARSALADALPPFCSFDIEVRQE